MLYSFSTWRRIAELLCLLFWPKKLLMFLENKKKWVGRLKILSRYKRYYTIIKCCVLKYFGFNHFMLPIEVYWKEHDWLLNCWYLNGLLKIWNQQRRLSVSLKHFHPHHCKIYSVPIAMIGYKCITKSSTDIERQTEKVLFSGQSRTSDNDGTQVLG